MTCRPRPETEETPQRRDTASRMRTIARWLHHTEDEILYTPDAPDAASTPSCDARYYLRWGGGRMGILAILRFPVDACHPETQKPYGTYAVGESFLFTYEGQSYCGRVIERQVSRADGLVELHVQSACGEAGTP